MKCELERGQRICPYCNVRHIRRCQKMLTDGGFVKLSGTGGLTRAAKALTDVWGRRIGNRFWDVLFNSLLYTEKTRSKLHLQPMTTRLSYLLNPFLLATALTNEISSFLYINQFGSISTSFWRYPLKSVKRKALGWISYFTYICLFTWKCWKH